MLWRSLTFCNIEIFGRSADKRPASDIPEKAEQMRLHGTVGMSFIA
jgi:hypothetical protein